MKMLSDNELPDSLMKLGNFLGESHEVNTEINNVALDCSRRALRIIQYDTSLSVLPPARVVP